MGSRDILLVMLLLAGCAVYEPDPPCQWVVPYIRDASQAYTDDMSSENEEELLIWLEQYDDCQSRNVPNHQHTFHKWSKMSEFSEEGVGKTTCQWYCEGSFKEGDEHTAITAGYLYCPRP